LKSHHLLLICALFVAISFCGTVSAADHTEYVSISSNGTLSNSYSGEPSVSADGRYVVFSSAANNLVTNDTNYHSDIFVRDLVSNITERVSISNNGEEANDDCYNPSISGNGRYVTFNSYANNLVLNDNNFYSDVFLHDRFLHTTIRISNSNTEEEVNGDSLAASISSDGRYVVFMSYATNLVLNDTNNFNDIFIYNISSGTTKRVSVTSTGGETNSNSFNPGISSDGRFVVFTSDANNLVANDTNGWLDIFVKDLKLNLITRISVSNSGEEGNGDSIQPSISGDGTCIAFTSYADNLSPNDGNYKSDIFVYNQLTKKIDRISINGEEINKDSHDPAISENGRYIVFIIGKSQPIVAKISNELNNVSFTDDKYVNGLFCYDTLFGTTKLISISDEGEIANDYCDEPAINSDGSYVVYSSGADNLVGNDDNLSTDIFVYIKKSSPASFSGTITPEIVKSGNIITIKAYSDDATHVTAFLFNETLNLTKQDDGKWLLYYNIPNTSSGIYDVLLTATYVSGIRKYFT
jgi:Tol biopolymer transport system component